MSLVRISSVLLLMVAHLPAAQDALELPSPVNQSPTTDAPAINPPAVNPPAVNLSAPDAAADERPLIVATKRSPPFAIKNADGQWSGISIELWKHLAGELNRKYEFRERTLDQMFNDLETGKADVAVAAISVTAERHQRVDFCHPHFTTGLGIAVSAQRRMGGWKLVRDIVSQRLLVVIGIMLSIVAVCGVLFWIVERQKNETMFGERRKGIGMGVWWSTILLLGHKGVIPISPWGRLLAAGAMICSIFLMLILTGIITSILTVGQLEAGISHPSDLRHVRVVTVASSSSVDYLQRRRISFQTRPTAEEALRAVVDGDADAVVYDEALLKYLTLHEFSSTMRVLSVSFNTQEYAIALQPESTLRKPLNDALLNFRASDSWDDLIFRYLGR